MSHTQIAKHSERAYLLDSRSIHGNQNHGVAVQPVCLWVYKVGVTGVQRSMYGCFTSGLVTPMTMATLQRGSPAPLLHHLRPLIMYESPSRVMVQEMLVASLDATPGSVITGRKIHFNMLPPSPLSPHSSSLSPSLTVSSPLPPHSQPLPLSPLTHSPSLSPPHSQPLPLPFAHSPPSHPSLPLPFTHIQFYLTCHAKTGANLALQQWFQPLFLLLLTTI